MMRPNRPLLAARMAAIIPIASLLDGLYGQTAPAEESPLIVHNAAPRRRKAERGCIPS